MAAILYAEVYFVCMLVIGLLLYWMLRSKANSESERWLRRVLICFLLNFAANFAFTLFNGLQLVPSLRFPASYFFKTCYHITLCVGVFTWCGYGETELKSGLFQKERSFRLLLIPLLIPIVGAVLNLWTHWLFCITESGAYVRRGQFQGQMGFLLAASSLCSARLIRHGRRETDPTKRDHFFLTASFPLCLLASWLLSFVGESVPVICVSIMVELLCLYMGTVSQQISLDKLTQVNNRQNLLGFMEYKLHSHEGPLYLLMMDVDYFKVINDTFGHLEGDNALILVAQALKTACSPYKRRPYIARYGGDEFIVILEAEEQEVHALCETINALLARAKDPAAEYFLHVSIGIARWEPGMTPRELVAAADAELYEIKRARKPS